MNGSHVDNSVGPKDSKNAEQITIEKTKANPALEMKVTEIPAKLEYSEAQKSDDVHIGTDTDMDSE